MLSFLSSDPSLQKRQYNTSDKPLTFTLVLLPHPANIQGFRSVVQYLSAQVSSVGPPSHSFVTIQVPRNTPASYLIRYACETFEVEWEKVGLATKVQSKKDKGSMLFQTIDNRQISLPQLAQLSSEQLVEKFKISGDDDSAENFYIFIS